MKRILFQGDSITDCERIKEQEMDMGSGYALLVQAQMSFEHPGEYEFYNRGIGGNRVLDLYARIKNHITNLRPDFLSILIGVNDVWAEIDFQNGVNADKYEKIYSMLIEELQEELPDMKIMIMEPFVLKGYSTWDTKEMPDKWNYFNSEVRERAKRARKVAEKYNVPFVELQKLFDEACETMDASYWLVDGVHPTITGHELLKREWIKAFEKINFS